MNDREGRREESRRRRDAGRRAEALAARYLGARQFEILERNAREGSGEIDLVARHAGEIVFVEVRFRARGARFAPEGTLGARKQRALAAAAARWLARRGLGHARCRFDVVAIEGGPGGFRVRHLPGAFVVDGGEPRRMNPGPERPEEDAPDR